MKLHETQYSTPYIFHSNLVTITENRAAFSARYHIQQAQVPVTLKSTYNVFL